MENNTGFRNGEQTPAYGNEKSVVDIIKEQRELIKYLREENEFLNSQISEKEEEIKRLKQGFLSLGGIYY